jgi:hypothetical protein
MRPGVPLITLLAVLALAGCGGGDDGSGPATTATTAPEVLPRGLAPAVRLAKTYAFNGRTRVVDTRMLPGTLLDPWRNPSVPVPKGDRLVAVQMTWLDRRDPFPIQWARFAARDDRGTDLGGAYLGPARRSGRLTIQPVGFVLGKGRRLARVSMTSIVKVWPFRAAWKLEV